MNFAGYFFIGEKYRPTCSTGELPFSVAYSICLNAISLSSKANFRYDLSLTTPFCIKSTI
jgi:hypothetical protein